MRNTAAAALLACLGALRAGAGLVTLAAPECVCAAAAPRMPEATYLCAESREALLAAAGQYTVCLAGCGRTADTATADEMRALLAAAKGTFVLDAGGLSAIGTGVDALAPCAGRLVVTPHPGEMARLAGLSVAQVLQMPADVARGFAGKTGAVTVLKGHRTLVAAPDGRLYRNTTGNAGLARGGSGDLLAGMVAGWRRRAFRLRPLPCAACGCTAPRRTCVQPATVCRACCRRIFCLRCARFSLKTGAEYDMVISTYGPSVCARRPAGPYFGNEGAKICTKITGWTPCSRKKTTACGAQRAKR